MSHLVTFTGVGRWHVQMEGHQMSRHFFIPLKRAYFEDFEAGTKIEEIRPATSHFGRAQPGDTVVLSLGYGKARRLTGRVAWVYFDDEPHLFPGWTACYGNKHNRAVRIGIVIDRPAGEAPRGLFPVDVVFTQYAAKHLAFDALRSFLRLCGNVGRPETAYFMDTNLPDHLRREDVIISLNPANGAPYRRYQFKALNLREGEFTGELMIIEKTEESSR